MDGMVWWAEAGIDVESADVSGVARVVDKARAESVVASSIDAPVPAPVYRRTAEAWLSRVRERPSARPRAR
jgi:hypothetical protein